MAARFPESVREMHQHRVVGVELTEASGDPRDPHVTALRLEDGRRIPIHRAISNIRYGVEAYHTESSGRSANVRIVGPCSSCGAEYLRAEDDVTLKDTLPGLATPGRDPRHRGRATMA